MTEFQKLATPDKLISMGFIEENDGSGDPRGEGYILKNDNYELYINAYRDISLTRFFNNGMSVDIDVKCDCLYDLDNIISFIK